jgi:hypothetical protein
MSRASPNIDPNELLYKEDAYKVYSKRRKDRPNYYDASLDREQPIPTDTEDALILIPTESKRKAVEYLKTFSDTKASTAAGDYNDLLKEFSDKQVTVSDSISSDLEQVTGKFTTFRNSILQTGDDNLTIKSGMTRPLQAMVTSLGRLGKKESREVFHRLFNSISVAEFAKANSDPIKRELRAWTRVFVSYP